MDAVGDAQDRPVDDAGPRLVGGLGVQLADGVGAVGQAQREGGHVELAGVRRRRPARARGRARPATPPSSSSGPATRRTRSASKRSLPAETGVWMVNTLFARTVAQAVVERPAGGHVLAGALGEQERRVALVEVPDRRREAERPDRAHAADAEHELLVEAHLAAANVQDVGDRPVRVGVLREVRVEQQDRHASDLGDPDRDRQVAPGQLDRHRSAAGPTRPGPARAAAGSGRSRGSRAPGGRRHRSTGGSSPCDRGARRRSPGRAMSLADFMWSPARTPRPPE